MRPEGPTESYQRYGDRGSEDVNRQVPGGGGRNGKVISISLLSPERPSRRSLGAGGHPSQRPKPRIAPTIDPGCPAPLVWG